MQVQANTKLKQLFNMHDSEHEGTISGESVRLVFQAMGMQNLYQGTISKDIRRLNYTNPQVLTITFSQLEEYYASFKTPSTYTLWKKKYDLKETLLQKAHLRQENVGAGPGLVPSVQEANLSWVVGECLPVYSNQIEVKLKKKPLQQGKPFVKIQIECAALEEAKHLEKMMKEFFDAFIKVLKEEEPKIEDLLSSVHLNTAVLQHNLNVFLTTSNQQLVELIEMHAFFLDNCFAESFSGEINAALKFNYNLKDFILNQDQNQYGFMTHQFAFKLQGQISNVMQLLRRFVLKDNIIQKENQEFWWIGLIHLENADMEFQFEKGEINSSYSEIKRQLLKMMVDLREFFDKLKEANIHLQPLLCLLKGKIAVEGIVGDWHLTAKLKINGLNEIFSYNYLQLSQSYDKHCQQMMQDQYD